VTDATTQNPLPGVNIVLRGTEQGAATGADGQFRIRSVPSGPQLLVVRFLGYRTAEREITVAAGETVRVDVALQPAPIGMQGVQVTALRPDLQPTGELDQARIEGADVADAGGLMRNVPGVDAVRRGALGYDPNVRGLSETEVGVYVDGMRTFPAGPLRMDSPLSHIDPSSIASVEVVKGPYALTWGPGNMSAIRVEQQGENPPPTPLTGTIHTGYDTNLQAVETTGSAMGRQGRWSYAASGAYRTGSDYDTGGGTAVPASYTSGDARGRVGVQLTSSSELAVSGRYQNQTDIDYPGRLLNAKFFRTGMGQVKYTVERDRGTLRGVDIRAHAQQTLHEMDNEGKPTFEAGTFPNGNPRPPLRIGVNAEVQNIGGRAAADLALGSAWSVEVGGDVLHTYRNATRPFRVLMNGMEMVPPFYDSNRVWPGVTITQEGGFLNASRRLGAVRVSTTGRIDFVQSDADTPSAVFLENANATEGDLNRTQTMLSGAVTASVPLSSVWNVSVGAGTVARPPDALELYSDRIPASKAQTSAEFQGNPFLDPERSTQVDAWVEGQTNQWTIRLSGFARRLDNYITLEPTAIAPLLPLSPSTVFRYINGEARFYGAEAQASMTPVDRLTLRAAGSYLWGRDETLGEPALGVSPASATLGARWTLPVSFATVTQWYLDGAMELVAEQDRVATARGETPTDSYTTVDLKTGVRLVRRVSLEAGVENLFDVAYTDHLNANNPFTGNRVFEPGRVVTMNLRVQF
jgi:iron complex outermembrane receptor protein